MTTWLALPCLRCVRMPGRWPRSLAQEPQGRCGAQPMWWSRSKPRGRQSRRTSSANRRNTGDHDQHPSIRLCGASLRRHRDHRSVRCAALGAHAATPQRGCDVYLPDEPLTPGELHDVVLVGNNWDGTVTIFDPHRLTKITTIDVTIDLRDRFDKIKRAAGARTPSH